MNGTNWYNIVNFIIAESYLQKNFHTLEAALFLYYLFPLLPALIVNIIIIFHYQFRHGNKIESFGLELGNDLWQQFYSVLGIIVKKYD